MPSKPTAFCALVTVLAVLLVLVSPLQAAPSATPSISTIQKTLEMLNPNPTGGGTLSSSLDNLAQMAIEIIKESMLWSQKAHISLRNEAEDIAATLLWAVLFAEITFTGFRLMLGSSIIEQLGLLTTKTFIYVIVAGLVPLPGAPAPWNVTDTAIRAAMFRLMHGGKYVGMQLIKSSAHPNVLSLDGISKMNIPSSSAVPPVNGWGSPGAFSGAPFTNGRWSAGSGGGYGDAGAFGPSPSASGSGNPSGRAEPIVYWTSWLGVEFAPLYKYSQTTGAPLNSQASLLRDREYKFSQLSLNARIWGENPADTNNISSKLRANGIANMDSLSNEAPSADKQSIWEDLSRGVLVGTMPLQMFGISMSIAGIQIGALITVVFTQMSMLVGSITAFNIASALGLAVLPLMYFKMFDKIWSQYLVALGSLALVPCFYYVLSAIGFVFSTFIFEQLFPLPAAVSGSTAASPSLAVLLNEMFFKAIESTMMTFGMLGTNLGKILSFAISGMIAIYLILGRVLFGSAVVAAFVSSGALFSVLAPRFAFRWQSAFGAEDVMDKIGEVFNGLQSAVGSGMGQMYSDAFSKGSNMVKGTSQALKRL